MKKPKAALSDTLKLEFRKDLELFQYFLVLINSSSPIRNVELMWADDLEMFDATPWPRVNTGEALVQLQSAAGEVQGRTSPSPSTHFCDLVHGFGAYEEQTCARSDKPAKERCRATGCSQVYDCHVGLMDIAVPVVCEGRYLGTLFSGQVLTAPPTAQGFARVRAQLAGQPFIDMARLEEAYFRVPVVTTAQLTEMVRTLEVFARYVANTWKRLEILSEFQQVREREQALDRRELAELLLAGQTTADMPSGDQAIHALARNVGLERLPDRVIVLRMDPPAPERPVFPAEAPEASAIGTHLAQVRVAHLIEDRCRGWSNTLATVVTPGEMCIFVAQRARTPGHERMLLDEMAQTLMRIARNQGMTQVRAGISGQHTQLGDLLRAYHEACSALDAGHGAVSWFDALPERRQQPEQALGKVLTALQGDSLQVASATREFLAAAAPVAANASQLQHTRGLLTWACEHLAREVASLGAAAEDAVSAKDRAVRLIVAAPNSFVMAETFRAFVDQIRQLLVQLYSQREEKIVSETHRLVRQLGPARVTIQEIARNLKLSAGHLGRVYSRTTGHTLEEYLIRQRLELGKRLLLDPRLHVAEVADSCGFCNPAYFASVFKKYMNCTPRAYAREPHRWGMPTPEPAVVADRAALRVLAG